MSFKHSYLIVLALMVVAVVANRYYQYEILGNYTIEVYAPCDPYIESCFMLENPEDDIGFQDGPYKKITILARYAPSCLEEHSCEKFSCDGSAGGCGVATCNQSLTAEGEVCTNTSE